MNLKKIDELIKFSGMKKSDIAMKCDMSVTSLYNLLAGADVKISTLERLAEALSVPVTSFFEAENYEQNSGSLQEHTEKYYRLEKTKAKIVVEMELDSDEFVKLGLNDKFIQVLKTDNSSNFTK